MIRSPTHLRVISCTLLLLLSCSGSGEGRPHVAQEGTTDVDRQRAQLLEAVKTGILSSLGLDREPRPTQNASEEELRNMYQRYREKLQEMRGNSSQMMSETWQNTTVLLPVTVELIKVLQRGGQTQSGHHMQWFRAVFHNKHNIQAELALARAELKISRQVLDRPTSVSPGVRQGVKVKINGMKLNKAPRRRITPPVASNVTMLDISPEVEKWMRTDGNLVVDVGIAVSRREFPEANPTLSLELGLNKPTRARRTRTPHSNKEDVCNEQGWCCRKSITVSFKDIGWTDWVVAPTEYTMHFCDGTCPHNYKPASMHTQVKSQLHQITKGGIPRPCCVPAAYEPMVLMHYDSRGKLKLTPFDDLIVSKCHCA